MTANKAFASILVLAAIANLGEAQNIPPGERPALGLNRVSQSDLAGGNMTPKQIRDAGKRIFSTPFNKYDGFGDGPLDAFDPDKTSPGNRPSLQGNGVLLRINGLDSQTCLECHSVLTNAVIPAVFAIGGVGGIGATAMPGPTEIDVDDSDGNGFAAYNGRVINPPFIFGSGGVELVAKEMTVDLELLKLQALANPNTPVPLVTKGVDFGMILFDGIDLDVSGVQGIDTADFDGDGTPDLVVQPFGRKGNNATIRKFDTGALGFHHGMQPEEITDDVDGDGIPDPGVDNDPDGDGVVNEILVGELSALHIFSVSLEKPRSVSGSSAQVVHGQQLFASIGCADCHVPSIDTNSKFLPVAFPEDVTDPTANVFYVVDLTASPAKFDENGAGGISVDMYSDLKRHDMGLGLAESTGDPLDPFFITPRLWGVADTAPYMHDGRASSLTEAIDSHGGEGQAAATAFGALPAADKIDILTFLRTLRTPRDPSTQLAPLSIGQ